MALYDFLKAQFDRLSNAETVEKLELLQTKQQRISDLEDRIYWLEHELQAERETVRCTLELLKRFEDLPDADVTLNDYLEKYS